MLRLTSVEDAISVYWERFGPPVVARERIASEGSWPEARRALAALFARGTWRAAASSCRPSTS